MSQATIRFTHTDMELMRLRLLCRKPFSVWAARPENVIVGKLMAWNEGRSAVTISAGRPLPFTEPTSLKEVVLRVANH